MKIVLPWPDRRLSPNSRLHWAVKAQVKAKARKDAAYLTYDAMPAGAREVRQHFAGDGPIDVQVTFYPPDRRQRDDDNMVGMLKAARDGICDALAINDRRFRTSYSFEDAEKPGRVEVLLLRGNPPIGDNLLSSEFPDSAINNEAGQRANAYPAISETLDGSASDDA